MSTYEVSEDIVVFIWDSEDKEQDPLIIQPHNPNGSPWLDAEEARIWAERRLNIYVEPVVEVIEDEPVVEVVEEEPAAIEAPAEEEEINA
jgi:hypothetical protein